MMMFSCASAALKFKGKGEMIKARLNGGDQAFMNALWTQMHTASIAKSKQVYDV